MAPPLIMSAINRGKRGKKSTRARVRSAMKHARKRARAKRLRGEGGRFSKIPKAGTRISKAEHRRLTAYARETQRMFSGPSMARARAAKAAKKRALAGTLFRSGQTTVTVNKRRKRKVRKNSGHTRFYGSAETTAAEREHMRRLKAISDAVMAATKNSPERASRAGGKKKMAKRGTKLKGKKKAAFLRKMARGRNAARRRRGGGRGRKVTVTVNRRRRARKNGAALERAHKGASAAMRGPVYGPVAPSKRRGKKSGNTIVRRRGAKRGAKRHTGGRGRRPSGKLARKLTALTTKIHKLEGRRRGGLKRRKSGGSRMTPAKSRISALRAKRHFMKGGRGFSPAASKYLRIHGFSKINRGNKMHVVKHGMDSIPTLLTHALVATVGWGSMTALGNWAGAQLAQKFWGGQYAAVLKPAVTALGTAAGFIGLRMYGKTAAQYSGLFAIGGIIGIVHNAIANAPTVTTATGEMKLSELLMLPIGSTLIPGVDLGPVDKRLHGYESPRKFLGAYANSGNRKDFSGYVQREAFEGPSAAPEQQLKREATLRRMKELQGKDAGGNRDAV